MWLQLEPIGFHSRRHLGSGSCTRSGWVNETRGIVIADKITSQGQLFGRNEIRGVEENKMKNILERMVDGLSIRSDGGGVSNLARSDLTAVCGRQVLNKCIGRWLMVG